MLKTCKVCDHQAVVNKYERVRIRKTRMPTDEFAPRVVCPYFSLSESYPFLYYLRTPGGCFKDSNSCSYCNHRFVDGDNIEFCIYDFYDKEKREMFYIPAQNKSNCIEVFISYWECPNCRSLNIINRKEKIIDEASKE